MTVFNSLSRLVTGYTLPAALSLASAAGVGGCMLDRRPIFNDGGTGGDGGTTVTDGGSSTGGDGGDGGMGGGPLISGSQYVPAPARPMDMTTLAPTRAFHSWQAGEIPEGRTLEGYDYCVTTGPASEIDEDSECPGPTNPSSPYGVLDSLLPSSTYRWKVRARFDGGHHSEWSALRVFQTDDSVTGWWRLDEGSGSLASDSSPSNNDGALQNGPLWTPGFLGQALAFGGTRLVAVSDDSSLDFGTGDFTFSAWVRSDSTGAHQAILHKGSFSLYKQDTGRLTFFTPGCGILISAGDVTAGDWHHALVRRAGTTVRLYLDGVQTGTGDCAENLTNGVTLALGCEASPCSDPFDGAIDDAIVTGASTSDPINEFCAGSALAGTTPLPAVCLP